MTQIDLSPRLSELFAANDAGDRDVTTTRVFNLCLVPETWNAQGSGYFDDVIRASQNLAEQAPTDYILHDHPSPTTAVGSEPHVTLTHIVLKHPKKSQDHFASAAAFFVGRKLELIVDGLHEFTNGQPFERIAKATDGQFHRLAESTVDHVVWANVRAEVNIRFLKQQIHTMLPSWNPELIKCVTPSGSDYTPHHTMFVGRGKRNAETAKLALPTEAFSRPRTVPHIVAIADCGPWGQVRRFETRSEKVREFLKNITPDVA